MKDKPNPRFRASNSDEKGLPIRLDAGGVRDISRPYANAKFKLIYDPKQGVIFVSPNTKVKTIQPRDFFD